MKLIVSGNQQFTDAEISASGSKNATLPILIAAILVRGTTILQNVPCEISDVEKICSLLIDHGIVLKSEGDNVLILENRSISFKPTLRYGTRYEALMIGVQLALFGESEIAWPGGCEFGAERPLDIHLDGFRNFGCEVVESENGIRVRMRERRDGRFELRYPSVGATANLLIFAASVQGERILSNCSVEPEVIELMRFLNCSGAQIKRTAEREFRIVGNRFLRSSGIFRVISDRIEVATYCVLSSLVRRRLRIEQLNIPHNAIFIGALQKAGVPVRASSKTSIEVSANALRELRPLEVETAPYPGFSTDLHPILVPLFLAIPGVSKVTEHVIKERFAYVQELRKMRGEV